MFGPSRKNSYCRLVKTAHVDRWKIALGRLTEAQNDDVAGDMQYE